MIILKFKNKDILNCFKEKFPGIFSDELKQNIKNYNSDIIDLVEKFTFLFHINIGNQEKYYADDYNPVFISSLNGSLNM